MSKEGLEVIMNRRTLGWGDLTIKEFNRDMDILQKQAKRAEFLERSAKNLQHENRHKMGLEKENERLRAENGLLWGGNAQYREALKKIEELYYHGAGVSDSVVMKDMMMTALYALEGWSR